MLSLQQGVMIVMYSAIRALHMTLICAHDTKSVHHMSRDKRAKAADIMVAAWVTWLLSLHNVFL